MYKVFFKESSFSLTDRCKINEKSSKYHLFSSRKELEEFILMTLASDKPFEEIIVHDDVEALLHEFCHALPFVEAAGGIVVHEDQLLVIERFGFLDLPKGHREEGESLETCAIREVEEECGLKCLEIMAPAPSTYHIYQWDGEWRLKRSSWFLMKTLKPQQSLSPQTEEDIEKVYWLSIPELKLQLSRTYPSLRPLLESLIS